MTHLLDIQPDDRILEIGTGSGYQAAIAAELASQVYTVEIIAELAESADKRLKSIGYTNVLVRAGDGWYGWPEAAPFDRILVTAVAPETPPQLLSQLAVGGRLVMPVGHPRGVPRARPHALAGADGTGNGGAALEKWSLCDVCGGAQGRPWGRGADGDGAFSGGHCSSGRSSFWVAAGDDDGSELRHALALQSSPVLEVVGVVAAVPLGMDVAGSQGSPRGRPQ